MLAEKSESARSVTEKDRKNKVFFWNYVIQLCFRFFVWKEQEDNFQFAMKSNHLID